MPPDTGDDNTSAAPAVTATTSATSRDSVDPDPTTASALFDVNDDASTAVSPPDDTAATDATAASVVTVLTSATPTLDTASLDDTCADTDDACADDDGVSDVNAAPDAPCDTNADAATATVSEPFDTALNVLNGSSDATADAAAFDCTFGKLCRCTLPAKTAKT
jgi:hypothetical protein